MYENGNDTYTAYQGIPVYSGEPQNGNRDKKDKESGKKGHVWKKVLLSVCLGLCFGVFAGAGFYAVQKGIERFSGPKETPQQTQEQVSDDNANVTSVSHVTYVQGDIPDVVDKVMPAMVSIVNYMETTNYWGMKTTEPAGGSGIIVSENDDELLIATNDHVVEDSKTLKVTFIDGTEAEASIKGLDAKMDLAVISVPFSELSQETREAIKVATLGDSDSLRLGEPVIAIGNAMGYGQSVTDGIISAVNREMPLSDGSTGTFLQTNADINPGNSGGALLNLNGEVIGINSNKIADYKVEGMGYAIPINAADPIIEELMTHQMRNDKVDKSEQGYMGISLQNITAQISEMYGMPKGAFVYSVEPGMAADKAGIIKGDIITGFDGRRVNSSDGLLTIMEYYKAGDTVGVTVKRVVNGEYESYDLEITLGEKP